MKNFSWIDGGTFVKFLTKKIVKKTTSPYISLYHNYQNSKFKNLNPYHISYALILYHIPLYLHIYPHTPLKLPTHIFYPITNKNPVEVNLRGSITILLYYIFQSSEAISSAVSSLQPLHSLNCYHFYMVHSTSLVQNSLFHFGLQCI